MLKTRKWLLAFSVALVGIIVSLLISFFPSIVEAKAEMKYFSAEQYTESDQLLQADGNPSPNRSIQDFATDVKSGYNGQSFPELAQVVPLEYLETTEENAEFSYNGKEYGFYIAKEENYFDILLIDFIYEFDDVGHTNNEYKIRIEPILQQRFNRTGTAGDYQWEKTANHYKYYVSNPRFLTVARNENDLNYGDTGYSKLTDDGVIIQQTRLNYSKILYKTEEDLWETCFEFGADKILSSATDLAVDFLDTYTFGLASFVKDLFDFTETLYEEGQEEKVEANNEANIFTQQSKTEQRNGPLDGYSRVATFTPADEIVLAAADEGSEDINDNSYAEFITVLSDTNYRTRLNQYCEFDIVRRVGNYDSMEPVNDKNTERRIARHGAFDAQVRVSRYQRCHGNEHQHARTEDCCQRRIKRNEVTFALRDCMQAAKKNGVKVERTKLCGGGEYKNVKEAAKAIVRVKETVLPDANTVALYAQRYVCFKKLYPALKSVFR